MRTGFSTGNVNKTGVIAEKVLLIVKKKRVPIRDLKLLLLIPFPDEKSFDNWKDNPPINRAKTTVWKILDFNTTGFLCILRISLLIRVPKA